MGCEQEGGGGREGGTKRKEKENAMGTKENIQRNEDRHLKKLAHGECVRRKPYCALRDSAA